MKQIATKCARAGVKIADALTNFAVLVALLVFMVVGIYGLWDNKAIEAEGMAATWQAYKPDPRDVDLGFEELRKINSEVQAWLTIYGTNIDYPVVYSENEWKYLNRNPKGEHALAGSLFFDSQTLPDLSSFPTVIYGHHMIHNAMFGQLDDYKDQAFLNEHRYGNYHYNGRDWGLEVIGFFSADAYDSSTYRPVNTSNSAGRNQYLERILPTMDPKREGAVVNEEDGLLLMSTCASDETNGRTVVVARITDETYPNPFPDDKNTGTGLDDDRGWFGIPKLVWVLFFIALAAFIAIFVVRRREDKKKKRKDSSPVIVRSPLPSLRGSEDGSTPSLRGSEATEAISSGEVAASQFSSAPRNDDMELEKLKKEVHE